MKNMLLDTQNFSINLFTIIKKVGNFLDYIYSKKVFPRVSS